jgi:uncharacterized membrane protein YgdD (TMEM256/DUF423 family)
MNAAARLFLVAGALLLALGTVAGAFGSHALRAVLTPSQLQTWQTGVEYQFFHALGLLAIGLLVRSYPSALLTAAGWCVIAGIVCFSGSLYLLAGLQVRWMGPITPLGGVALIAGWVLCATALLRMKAG